MSWPRQFGPRVLLALAIGLVAGWIAEQVRLPLPWMLGPMIVLTICALAGLPVEGPVRLRPAVIPVLGVMLGSSLTPEIAAAAPRWTLTVVLLVPYLVATAFLSFTIYRRIGGYDRVTAYYSAMPGGLNEMILLGHAAGGDDRKIALAHALRVLIVILCISLLFGLVLGVTTGGGRNWVPMSLPSLGDWAYLIGAALLGVPLGRILRLPANQLTGPMILSGLAHITGLVTVPPPTLLVVAAQLVIGATLGCRFSGIKVRDITRDMGLAVVSSLSMIAIAVVFAGIVHWLTQLPIEQAFLAYSPGGLAEMSLLALALHQDVAYVAVMHIIRIMMVISGAAIIFRKL